MRRPGYLLLLSLSLPVLALMPPVRQFMEASMLRHMLVLIPLLVLAGFIFSHGIMAEARKALSAWNTLGAPGLLLASSILATWMVPYALDRAIESPAVDAAKVVSLFVAGLALGLSVSVAPLVTQLFFVWNWVAMTVFVGVLYQSLPQRLCSAYLLDDQGRTGLGLIVFAVAIGCMWCAFAWSRNKQTEVESAGG